MFVFPTIASQGTKQLKLDPTIYESLQKSNVQVGDIIYIEANSGAVSRQGRSDAFATEFDLEAEEYVPLPKVCSSALLRRSRIRFGVEEQPMCYNSV